MYMYTYFSSVIFYLHFAILFAQYSLFMELNFTVYPVHVTNETIDYWVIKYNCKYFMINGTLLSNKRYIEDPTIFHSTAKYMW